MIEVIHCERCDIPIAVQDGKRWEWTDDGAGVSEISDRELCGCCLKGEDFGNYAEAS